MHKLIVGITLSAMLSLAGCVYVMDENLVVSQRGNKSTINIADNCSTDPLMAPIISTLGHVAALDSNGFSNARLPRISTPHISLHNQERESV